jgi:C-terminal processing protease CtpA/Prc
MLTRLRDLVRDRYVLERDAPSIADGLTGLDLRDLDPAATAQQLTRYLQRVNNDRHLRVRHRPDGAATGFSSDTYRALHEAEARRNAGGVERVHLLGDGVGLLRIAPYLSPVHLAEPHIRAAFTLLSAVTGLVIDLRGGRGGTPSTVALLCGHLLGDEPVHLQDMAEREGTPHQFWTTPAAVRVQAPVRVLTSSETFSGCEELAYNLQALGRATVIGETTGGGAHPVEAIALTDVLELHLPVARSVNAVTGTNWEQVGVVPDIPCPAEDALAIAIKDLAIKDLAQDAP